MKQKYVTVQVALTDLPPECSIYGTSNHDVSGHKTEHMHATDDADKEENAVRLAEQMVRNAFARARR